MWLRSWCLIVCALPALCLGAPALAIVTIADGDVRLVRRDDRMTLAEGVRLEADDIVETGPQARLLRLEFSDGAVLDLGPASQLLLAPRWQNKRDARPGGLYLLQGWAKLSAAPAGNAMPLATPALDVTALARQAVVQVQPAQVAVFAEAGELTLVARGLPAPAAPQQLKSGEFYARSASAPALLAPRPTPAFIAGLPRAFLDTLPVRAALFKDRDVQPKRLGDIVYADAQPWIDAEAGLRRSFVTRWQALAKDPVFRDGLIDGLARHPEWDRVLFPEKYLPKPAAAPAPAKAGASAAYR